MNKHKKRIVEIMRRQKQKESASFWEKFLKHTFMILLGMVILYTMYFVEKYERQKYTRVCNQVGGVFIFTIDGYDCLGGE